jgi:hypothetical protein
MATGELAADEALHHASQPEGLGSFLEYKTINLPGELPLIRSRTRRQLLISGFGRTRPLNADRNRCP